jgi:hypothetical protein
MTLGSTQPLTEMSTRNLPGGKGRPARQADNSAPSVSRLSKKCGNLDVSHTYGSPRPVREIALLLQRRLQSCRALGQRSVRGSRALKNVIRGEFVLDTFLFLRINEDRSGKHCFCCN